MSKNNNREEFLNNVQVSFDRSVQEWKEYYLSKQDSVWVDDDGYPTEDALDLIEKWHWIDGKGWFKFIEEIWYFKSWGWKECEAIDEITNKKTWCYYISTAGWSGNESLTRSMERNSMMWYLTWVQSRRGGHYIFELKDIQDE